MAFARNSEERYGAVIGSELWYESESPANK
jgi:hypothetical protein